MKTGEIITLDNTGKGRTAPLEKNGDMNFQVAFLQLFVVDQCLNSS